MQNAFLDDQASPARSLESQGHRSGDGSKRYRPKRHLAWEEADLASHGLYGENFRQIAEHYPMLTPMQLKVAALVKAQLPSWRIAEILRIREETVDNHRCSTRKKIGLKAGNLQSHLATI